MSDDEPITDANHAFVQKPFTSDQLAAAIESVRCTEAKDTAA
jgi:hypothetical protein